MKQFTSIEKLDTGILYLLELASSLSILLLAFGLIASMANVLTKGSVLSDSAFMRQIWAWTQCIAIDASVAGTIIRTFHYHTEGEKVKAWLYGLLSALLLFTAAIVLNIESMAQTLNLTLEAAYVHVFIPIEALIWVRSITIVLLIIAHALRHISIVKKQTGTIEVSQPEPQQPVELVITPELLETLRSLLMQTLVTEESETHQALPAPKEQELTTLHTDEERGREEQDTQEPPEEAQSGQHESAYDRVKAYLTEHPQAKIRDVSEALNMPMSTANKWMKRVKEEPAA